MSTRVLSAAIHLLRLLALRLVLSDCDAPGLGR